jgi:DNA modification methylase
LRENPYCSIFPFKSTPGSAFVKDESAQTVNQYQKPLSLYLRLLKMFAMPGTLIIDATLGTGSLEIAALELTAPKDLMFISFERNNYQAKHAQRRIASVCQMPTNKNNVPDDVEYEIQCYNKKGEVLPAEPVE